MSFIHLKDDSKIECHINKNQVIKVTPITNRKIEKDGEDGDIIKMTQYIFTISLSDSEKITPIYNDLATAKIYHEQIIS